ncbi:hypothetical protein [Cognatilysobacter terrigena]|uniref:hypothetical protein n=1 Tax=Cognatilysobacter terrigena TaxID=2488749 RepID=UPI001060AEFF|nr:hypothetical protein [Lysobacter terrigena]
MKDKRTAAPATLDEVSDALCQALDAIYLINPPIESNISVAEFSLGKLPKGLNANNPTDMTWFFVDASLSRVKEAAVILSDVEEFASDICNPDPMDEGDYIEVARAARVARRLTGKLADLVSRLQPPCTAPAAAL